MKLYRIYVSGLVHGVGFRYYVRDIAGKLNLTGYVKNISDGRVLIIAEGDEETLAALATELKTGYFGKNIKDIEVTEEGSSIQFTDFRISF